MAKPLVDPRAAYDLYFLLNRGHPLTPSLNIVAARYRLDKRQRLLLARCIQPAKRVEETRRRLIHPEEAREKCLAVDGFNQLTTIHAALAGWNTYRCLDRLVRDDQAAGPRHVAKHWKPLAQHLAAALATLRPAAVVLVFDSQPSRSREVAAAVARLVAEEAGVNTVPVVSRTADRTLTEYSRECIVATSDQAVVEKANRVLDLAAYTLQQAGLARSIVDMEHLIHQQHQEWCSHTPITYSPSRDAKPSPCNPCWAQLP